MIFSIFFAVSLTGIVSYASAMVWKTEQCAVSEKKKFIAILFSLLVLVISINEAKNQNLIRFSLLGFQDPDCSDSFYALSPAQLTRLAQKYSRLPLFTKHAVPLIERTILPNLLSAGTATTQTDAEDKSSLKPGFLKVILSQENSGASHALKSFVESLHASSTPAFYVRLSGLDLPTEAESLSELEIANFETLKKTIENMNRKRGLTPYIIIDNFNGNHSNHTAGAGNIIENAFATNNGNGHTIIAEQLVEIAIRYSARIIIHSHNRSIADSVIMRVPRSSHVVEVMQFDGYYLEEIIEYANENLKDKLSKINWTSALTQLYDTVGIPFSFVYRIINDKNVPKEGVEKLIATILREHKEEADKDQAFLAVFEAVKDALSLKEKQKSTSRIISLREFKQKAADSDVAALLRLLDGDKAWIDNGYLSFSMPHFNSLFS